MAIRFCADCNRHAAINDKPADGFLAAFFAAAMSPAKEFCVAEEVNNVLHRATSSSKVQRDGLRNRRSFEAAKKKTKTSASQ